MRVLFYFGSVLGWVFLIYFCWNQSIPWWFKKGVAETVKTIPEITRQIPKEDWAKPKEEPKPEDKKPGESKENKPVESKEETSKKLFSGEFKLGGLRSKYNLDIPQNKESEAAGKQDMGVK
jgi:hypothetical protein